MGLLPAPHLDLTLWRLDPLSKSNIEDPMSRKLLITIHMYLSSFFAPFVFLVAISGGLYLAGVKGEVELKSIYQGPSAGLDASSSSLHSDIGQLLAQAGVSDYAFETVKVKGDTLYTRPTSRQHYVVKLDTNNVEVFHAQPSLQSALIELHKGHGPSFFKTFQQVFALSLVLVIASGLWLGLSANNLRRSTLLTSLAGSVVFLLLVIL